jgi:hypothetical protein
MEWANFRDGTTDIDLRVNPGYTAASHAAAIQANRDFYDDVVTGDNETGFVYAPTGFSYKPLPYPHPLTQGLPSPPSNIRAY